MSNKQKHEEQRYGKPLLFPMKLLNELKMSFKYIYKQLTMSMRRRIAFDYTMMFILSTLFLVVFFGTAYTLYEVKKLNDAGFDKTFELATLKDKGYYEEEELEQLLLNQAKAFGVDIRLVAYQMNSEADVDEDSALYDIHVSKDNLPDEFYQIRIENILKQLFQKGKVITSRSRTAIISPDMEVKYEMVILQTFMKSDGELLFLLIIILIAQIIAITAMSYISSYRLKKVFRPIYTMTKAAEKISINDMEAKLDVSKAEYELKDLALTFNEMLDRIRKDYDKQKRFVSDVSHELRTPISIVNGYARMLERWGKEDESVLDESIDAIKSESKNMQTLVENLLTLVRSENQTLKFEREYFNIDEMVLDMIKDMEMIDEKRHQFEHDISGPIEVCLDYAKTMQTLRIFIDNAIKYTPEGGRISINVYQELDNVVISIIDTGIGIPKKDLPFLFDRFFRSDLSRTRETGGHGLGLSIAKAMILGQKGKIKVKSKESEGSEFIIMLPLSYGESL